MEKDPWHYPRFELAKQILGMFETKISSALVFFAPRRMGKTEFLCKDILPLATSKGWNVFYFSFLDVGVNATVEFTQTLATFSERKGILGKARRLSKIVKKISGGVAGVNAEIELRESVKLHANLKEIFAHLAAKGQLLLLLDEVQVLAKDPANINFIASLRTALDIYKDDIKVIFTGSSQNGLRRMFSQANAPFFHFGQNLPFPELERGFTEHLADMFKIVTGRTLDRDLLWKTFQEIRRIPQLARALVERLALNPGLTIEKAKTQLMAEIFDARAFADTWEKCSALEQLLLRKIAQDLISALFSVEFRQQITKELGIKSISASTMQAALRTLQRKELIGRLGERGGYFIEDLNFKNWLCLDQEK
ncbi:MAG: hypothetical protein M1561_04835 [Gammaproteobacteria bacterium]|nr:hypothetical protein [Gammaproteobacteria bacterium]